MAMIAQRLGRTFGNMVPWNPNARANPWPLVTLSNVSCVIDSGWPPSPVDDRRVGARSSGAVCSLCSAVAAPPWRGSWGTPQPTAMRVSGARAESAKRKKNVAIR